VREEMDKEIRGKGMTPAEWIKSRGVIDTALLCKKLGLENCTIVKDKARVSGVFR